MLVRIDGRRVLLVYIHTLAWQIWVGKFNKVLPTIRPDARVDVLSCRPHVGFGH
ncbi:hypothetical protein [Snodgrassella sp. CFCC 13594]|uniref:hypothetical protein n=1 Tax=Snodgrassella sp. CFCC 13594 TaxID=1775559 RepID=UPI000AA15127|nr:hypothetical protein [Snodgrassella sp. CFCC 13594]